MEKRITALKVQKKKPDRVNVYLDGEFAFGVSRFVGAGLAVGQILSPSDINRLNDLDTHERAFQTTLKFIGFKPRTEYEVIKRLESGGYSQEVISSVMEELRQKHYIRDTDYAAQWVDIRVDIHPRSRRLLARELRGKGIPETIIQDVLSNIPGEYELASALGNANFEKYRNLDEHAFENKMKGILARKGFDFEIIYEVIEQLLKRKVQQ